MKDKNKIKGNDNMDQSKKDEKIKEKNSNKNDTESKIRELEEKNKELVGMLQRLQAEFENYKKRMESQKADLVKGAAKEIVLELLPVLDNFDAAIKHSEKSSKEDLIKGFEMIHKHVLETLVKNGLEEINPMDKDFDPFEHEALMQEESDKKQHTVIEVLQKGYKLNDKVIRHAKVKIAK